MKMNDMPQSPLSDELLSAYIDGDATEAEKQQIEFAIANDPEVAWQIETLRQTIELLRDLPLIPAPRSFVLEEAQVADVLAARREQRSAGTGAKTRGASFWRQLLAFFSSGNLALRNAAAIASALFVVVTLSRAYFTQGPIMSPGSTQQPVALEISSESAQPAAAEMSVQDQSQEDAPAPLVIPEPAGTSTPPDADSETSDISEQAMLRTVPSEETLDEESSEEENAAPDMTTSIEMFAFATDESTNGQAARTLPQGEESTATVSESAPADEESFTITGIEESSAADTGEVAAEAAALTPPTDDESAESAMDDSAVTDSAITEDTTTNTMMVPMTGPAGDEEAETAVVDLTIEEAEVMVAEEAVEEVATEDASTKDIPAEEAPEASTPEDTTVSMTKQEDPYGADTMPEGADRAAAATSPAETGPVSWQVWQTMQVGLLSLSLILLLLWLGSRRRV